MSHVNAKVRAKPRGTNWIASVGTIAGGPLSYTPTFAEDFLLPAQVRACRGDRPELALWRAVLLDALACYRNRRKYAAAWFAAETEAPGSFLWVCQVLGLDAAYVRASLGETRIRQYGRMQQGYGA